MSNLSVIKESVLNGMKTIREYPANLFSALWIQVFFTLEFVFGYILIENFSGVIEWGFMDYAVFLMHNSLIFLIFGTFYWGNQLRSSIPRGELNSTLYKPKNSFFIQYFSEINSQMLTFVFLDLFTVFPIVMYFVWKHCK
jgi:hypothetical protein